MQSNRRCIAKMEGNVIRLTLDEVFTLSKAAVLACGATEVNAISLARSIREAEAEGIRNVGLRFLPYYCDHLLQGAIVGDAVPAVFDKSPAVVLVDAKNGLAHPAYDLAEDLFYNKARTCGLAALAIKNAYYNGVEGYFVKRMAEQELIGFACTNAMSMVAPYGGRKPFLGTNPLAFGVSRKNRAPLIIDLSTSTTAFVNVAAAAADDRRAPDTWALDSAGQPTTDPHKGLQGRLQPLGGPKGTGLGLIVEILAAGLAGSHWSFEVPAFTTEMSEPPQIGQFYLAIDASQFGNPDLASRLEVMLGEMLSQGGVRLPGDSRVIAREKAETEGVEVEEALYKTLRNYAQNSSCN